MVQGIRARFATLLQPCPQSWDDSQLFKVEDIEGLSGHDVQIQPPPPPRNSLDLKNVFEVILRKQGKANEQMLKLGM